jgi:predicted component of type VI protein secretion system
MQVKIVMINEAGERSDFTLPEGIATLGRGEECDIRVPLPSISRRHCQIVQEDEDIVMRDLGSTNGTFHNNQRVQEAILEPGDHLRLGDVIFTVVINDKPGEIAPVRTFVPEEAGEEHDAHLDELEPEADEPDHADIEDGPQAAKPVNKGKEPVAKKPPGGVLQPLEANNAPADVAEDESHDNEARAEEPVANDPLAALAALNKEVRRATPKR